MPPNGVGTHAPPASNYDCGGSCPCPFNYTPSMNYMSPSSLYVAVDNNGNSGFYAGYQDCNYLYYYYNYTTSASWSSQNSSIASIQSVGLVRGVSAGATSVSASYNGYTYRYNGSVCIGTFPVPGGGTSPATVTSLSQSPSQFNMSTGDTKQIAVTVTPSNVPVTLSFSGRTSPTSNPDSSGAATLTINGSGSGTINAGVTASPAGNSGVYSVTASGGGATSSNSTTVDIPPQVLIQMMQAEAGGTGNSTAMQGLGDVAQNRIHSSIFNPPYSNYQNTIVAGQFALTSTATGIEPELDLSVNVFTGSSARFCGALAFWTPTATQWTVVQNAINNPSTTFPSGTGAPTFSSWPQSNQEIVYVSSVGTQSNGAPNFLFLIQRSPSQYAAVAASCSP